MTRETLNKSADLLKRLASIIDLEKYPIHIPEHPATQALIKKCRAQLDDIGCSVVPDFIRPESLLRMKEEAYRLHSQTYWSEQAHNPYMSKEDTSLPEDHPNRHFENRTSGFINSNLLEEDSDLRILYDWDVLTRFVGECVGVWPIYQWADPLARCPYAVMKDGHYFPWHFDGNEFTISISVEQPEEGGVFEYAPNIRDKENENVDGVKRILKGDRNGVHELVWHPGALQLFKGRFALHRVTPAKGKGAWITALPTYVLDPETVNRPERSKQFYGQALPIHYEREARRPDTLLD